MKVYRITFNTNDIISYYNSKKERKKIPKKVEVKEYGGKHMTFFDKITDEDITRGEELLKEWLIPTEEAKYLEELPGTWITNFGRVFSLRSDKAVYEKRRQPTKARTNTYYRFVYRGKDYSVSRAVAHLFIDNNFPLCCPDVPVKDETLVPDHINMNTLDNRVENLRIVTQKKNLELAIENGKKWSGRHAKKCYSYNIHTKELKEYPSTKELEIGIWGFYNGGNFNNFMKHQYLIRGTYYVGYDPEKLKKLCED